MHFYGRSIGCDKIMYETAKERIEECGTFGDNAVKEPEVATSRDFETAYKDRPDVEPYDPTYWEDNREALTHLITQDQQRRYGKRAIAGT